MSGSSSEPEAGHRRLTGLRKILICLGTLLTLATAGCSQTARTAGSDARSMSADTTTIAPGQPLRRDATTAPMAAAGDSSVPTTAQPTTAPRSTAPRSTVQLADATGAKRVTTATVALTTSPGRVSEVAAHAGGIAEAAGGTVDEQRDTGGRRPSADLVLKVPPDRAHDVVTRLGSLATVRSSDEQTEDVTGQYADLDGRLGTLRISIARLQGFLAKTTDVNQIAQLESELTQRESDLESMQSQIDALSARIAQATVHVTITSRVAPPAVPTHEPPSAASALAGGWRSFTGVVRWVLAGLAVSLPYIGLALLGLLGVRFARRRSRRTQVV